MQAMVDISAWDWAIFILAILMFLALDLGVFHRKAHVVRFKEALGWTIVWFIFAMLFAVFMAPRFVENWGRLQTVEFVTGYIIELSLSMDNVFVIALIFAYFRVPSEYQHRVLFWGILGALVMRGLMIWLGTELIHRFHWMLYVFGAFLVFSGIRMSFVEDEGVHPEKNFVIRLARKFFPISPEFHGQKFITFSKGRRVLTPLALVLLMVETTDLVFALDSIPAIFAVTQNSFIVFSSNVLAILGLRSLYFVLANAINFFRYLKIGLSIVLVFIGLKMLIAEWYKISTSISLIIVAGIILLSILASVIIAKYEERIERAKRPVQS
jgi:tellurite resistance protein TerC